jgi:transcriptional regulator with XRE-family HTH domain
MGTRFAGRERLPGAGGSWLGFRISSVGHRQLRGGEGIDEMSDEAGDGTVGTSEEIQEGEREKAKGNLVECSIHIGGIEFVLVPCAEYARLRDKGPRLAVDRPRNGVGVAARRLRDARRQAGLTQAALAERLGRSQSTVSQAESGLARIGERYVGSVLAACQLDANWGLAQDAGSNEEAASGWALDPKDIAGLDPETFEPVRRGSERDLELCRTLVWWGNRWPM